MWLPPVINWSYLSKSTPLTFTLSSTGSAELSLNLQVEADQIIGRRAGGIGLLDCPQQGILIDPFSQKQDVYQLIIAIPLLA
jgi:hypothetical protein